MEDKQAEVAEQDMPAANDDEMDITVSFDKAVEMLQKRKREELERDEDSMIDDSTT